jgi:3-phenylpropionate/trans-cinnamate dioxygenase subunit alpha
MERWVSDDGVWVSRRVFCDARVHALEQERVFGRSWLFLGHESQVEAPGAFFLTRMGEESVILARDPRGALGAFLNTCRHRGMRLCREDAGTTRAFTCPYHGWSYGTDGRLAGVPDRERAFPNGLDREALGLIRVPRVESFRGLVFGSFDAAIAPLAEHLGGMAGLLDVQLDRSGAGTEVLGLQKWIVETNWKMPAENQVGDVAHGAVSHASALKMAGPAGTAGLRTVLEFGRNVSFPNGHGGTIRVYPHAEAAGSSPGAELLLGRPDLAGYFERERAAAGARLGAPRDRVKIATATVFPNFSILGSNSTIRVAHPRSATSAEIWSWVLVDRAAPEPVKQALKEFYQFTFGPAGIFEQDDGENWEEVTAGAQGREAGRHAFYYGMGLGSEGPDPELPGAVSHVYSEHPQRAFYRTWQALMDDGPRPALDSAPR